MPVSKPIIVTFFSLLFMPQLFAQKTDFEIQGHRGARGLMPENTIPAFLRAIDEGVDTIELDVVISKDGKVVVSHEPYFNPPISTLPSGEYVQKSTQGNTYELSYRKIKKYDVGKRGNPLFPEQQKMAVNKPLLKKTIKAIEKYAKKRGLTPLKYNIELKSLVEEYNISQPEPQEFCNLVSKIIAKKLPAERVTIQSFDFNILKYWNKEAGAENYPKVALSALIEPEDNNDVDYNLEKLGFTPDIWSPYFKKLTKDIVNELHRKNIKVIPWTVNEISDMKSIKTMGCDGLITDYPNRAKMLTK
ncbi:MAG: glycerophosphodiester phosphodiesterase [Spirosomaceae bacterium]|nr:glycerophosphodiester phosphodiesterase [Spirosomataceae bacterium]